MHITGKRLLAGWTGAVFIFGSVITGMHAADIGKEAYAQVKEDKLHMSYLYVGNTASYLSQVAKAKGSVDVVSPSYLDIDEQGNLVQRMDSLFVQKMHAQGIRVTPFLSNHWDRDIGVKGLENRRNLSKQVADAVRDYDLDGVNVDIENVPETSRQAYTEFVQLLREQLPKGKQLSVAVPANPQNFTKGWHGAYDYLALSKAADFLMLMAYDESYTGGPAGAVASLPWVEKSIQHVLAQGVPSDRLVLGVPFYGRYWKDGQGGYGIANHQVESVVRKMHGTFSFDAVSQTPYATWTSRAGSPKVTLNYRTLEPGNYTVWYENADSIKLKLKLVQKYDLRGVGSWALNQAPEDTWEYFTAWLNGEHYFLDMEQHWAEQEAMMSLEKGWMKGESESHFAPGKPLTRAQAAVVLVRALGLHEGTGEVTSIYKLGGFSDVPAAHWAQKEIALAYQAGLLEGYPGNLFQPDQPVTRAEMASLLMRGISLQTKEETPPPENLPVKYRDLPMKYWAYEDIVAVSQQQLMTGYPDQTFRPQQIISRAEMAVILARMANE